MILSTTLIKAFELIFVLSAWNVENGQMMDIDYSTIPYYYGAINLLGSIGNLLFLYGVYSFFKRYFANSLDGTTQKKDLNSFIQRN